jgi:hypothetical protein
LGGIYLIKNKTREGVFLWVNYLVILFGAVFLWNRNAGEQYIFFAKPFQIILIASGIWVAADFLKNNLKKYNTKIYWIMMFFLITSIINWNYFVQRENTYTQNSDSSNPNYRNVFGYIVDKKGMNDILVTRNFRNFYWQGAKMQVFSLGGERAKDDDQKITLEELREIIGVNNSGWIVYSDNDSSFISKEAEAYMADNLEKINNLKTKGPVTVYYWNNLRK